MPININNYIASGNPGLYAGPILFREGRVDTPLLSMISSRRRFTDAEMFIIGQTFAAPKASDSVVSENQAATEVPDFAPTGRKQDTNVTQIMTKSIAQTDYSTGNTGMLLGPNLAGQQTGNPAGERDFQRTQKVLELAQDLEYSFINSKYQFRNGDRSIPNRTRGLIDAIKTNVLDVGGNELSWMHLLEVQCSIADNGGVTNGLVLGCDDVTATQIALEAKSEKFEVITGMTTIGGIAVTNIRTTKGFIQVVNLRYLPEGTALLLNIPALSIVEQPFENGNWTWFDIGRQAGSRVEMLQGACGLDYGYEGAHALIKNIATGFTPYKGVKMFVPGVVKTTESLPEISGVALASAQVGVESALGLEYTSEPAADPTLTYQWQTGKSNIGIFTDVEGETNATITPTEDMVGLYLRCKVTAADSATGTVTSNTKKVVAAE